MYNRMATNLLLTLEPQQASGDWNMDQKAEA